MSLISKTFAPDGIFAELARQHYDTANATSVPAMAALLKLVPPSQVTYGTDYPYFPLDQDKNPDQVWQAQQRSKVLRRMLDQKR